MDISEQFEGLKNTRVPQPPTQGLYPTNPTLLSRIRLGEEKNKFDMLCILVFISVFFCLISGCPVQLSKLMVNNGNTFVDDDQDLVFAWRYNIGQYKANVTNILQEWFQIEVSSDNQFSHLVWQSGRIKSQVNFNIFYKGNPLKSSTTYYYRIHAAISFQENNMNFTHQCVIFNSNSFNTALSKLISIPVSYRLIFIFCCLFMFIIINY